MASKVAPANDADIGAEPSAVEVAGDFLLIDPADIDAEDRLRPIDDVWAQRLGEMMAIDKQRTPIEVCRLPGRSGFKLVAGGHRHAAFCLFPELGRIKAIVVDAERLSRRVGEISENLHRKDLDPIDRATFISELVVTKKLQAGIDLAADERATAASVAANVRWKRVKAEAGDASDTMSVAYGWSKEVADSLGFSARTIERDLVLIRGIQPSVVEILRVATHPILSNASQLRALAKLDADQQATIVARMCGGDAPISLADAIKAADAGTGKPKGPQSDEDKRLSTFLGTFSRMSLSEKKGALAHLMEVVPAGFVLLGMDAKGVDTFDSVKADVSAAFNVAVQLVDGEPVDDEQLADAVGALQSALHTVERRS